MIQVKRYLFFVQQAYSYAILRPMQDAIRKRGGEVAWFLNGSSVSMMDLKDDEVLLQSVAEVKKWQPLAVFVPGNVVPDFFPGLKVQVFHGLEWKKKGHFLIRGFFDLYCTHGPITTIPFQRLAKKHGYFSVEETGWPKLDPCFPLPEHPGLEPETIVFAPTFSPSLTSAMDLLPCWEQLAAQEKWRVRVKFHPKMAGAVVKKYVELAQRYSHIEVCTDDSLIPLIQSADLVVSDTSSAISEALLLGRPVVTYRNSSPDAYLLNFTKPQDLETYIKKGLCPDKDLQVKISEYIEQVHPYRDGKSSDRILDAVDKTLKAGVRSKPLNLYRRYKIRKSMGYMHWS